jgi:hypothetical protein
VRRRCVIGLSSRFVVLSLAGQRCTLRLHWKPKYRNGGNCHCFIAILEFYTACVSSAVRHRPILKRDAIYWSDLIVQWQRAACATLHVIWIPNTLDLKGTSTGTAVAKPSCDFSRTRSCRNRKHLTRRRVARAPPEIPERDNSSSAGSVVSVCLDLAIAQICCIPRKQKSSFLST